MESVSDRASSSANQLKENNPDRIIQQVGITVKGYPSKQNHVECYSE